MFEQSILVGQPASRKIARLFASMSVQIVAAGVLFLIPLIYMETLPMAKLPFVLPLRASQPEQPQPIDATKPVSRAVRPNVFRVPFRIPVLSSPANSVSQSAVIDSVAPQISLSGAGAAQSGFSDLPMQIIQAERPAEPARPVPAAPPKVSAAEPVRVASDVQSAKIIRKIVPQYPALARQARISGVVKLMGIIAKDGTVQQLQVISGHPLLQKAALDAVSQWLYQPTILNGKPVEVIAPIDVIFTLSQ
jgi:protein TonB